jgi:hypothetical protein
LRKRFLLLDIGIKVLKLVNKVKFLECLGNRTIILERKTKKQLVNLMKEMKFTQEELFQPERYKQVKIEQANQIIALTI